MRPVWCPFQIRFESERQGYTDQMSQALIAIIVAATVAVALTAPVHAQVDCADWNTRDFFLSGEISDVTRCLHAGANPNARGENGWTPLHQATMLFGTVEAVRALLEAGADPNARTEFGYTPLHEAATSFGTTVEAVTALLEAGADHNTRDSDGKLPFDYAEDNEQLKGTDAYWKLNDARFQ